MAGTSDAFDPGPGECDNGRVVFSSDDFDQHLDNKSRMNRWRDVYTANYGETDIQWLGDGPFRARSEFVAFGDVTAGHIDYMFHHVARSKRQVAQDSREQLIIGFMKDAPVRAKLGERELDAPANSVFFYSTARPVDFRNELGRIKGNTLVLPHAALAQKVANLDDLVSRLLNPSDPSVNLLARYVELVMSAPGNTSSFGLGEHIRHTLFDLAALAVGAQGENAVLASERGLRAGRLAAIKADIRENIGRRSISPKAVAARHGITPRYLHILFEDQDKTFGEFVAAERLAKASRHLTDPRHIETRISDIAFAVGFEDLSTFNRQFKRHYGVTPSEARHAALLGERM